MFSIKKVSWRQYLKRWQGTSIEEWILRGQSGPRSKTISLRSGLERALISYQIPLSKALEIEEWMIREFRRKYEGIDSQMVINDSLYCLSMMQHYGSPTRLLDFTYSPYIAAFFAVENISFEPGAEREAFIFCINHKWINESVERNIDDHKSFEMRFDDKTITDDSFVPLYMKAKRSFIVAENPHRLHRRLSIQRGVFIIQGDISRSMMDNIKSMNGWQKKENIIIYRLKINTKEELKKVYEDLRLMNVTRESLFPGLDGFSKSLKQNLYWYQDLKKMKDNVNPFVHKRG